MTAIVTEVAPVASDIPTIMTDIARVRADIPPITSQFRSRVAIPPVLAQVTNIGAALSFIVPDVTPIPTQVPSVPTNVTALCVCRDTEAAQQHH
jgi:hypothetical protein